MIQQYADSMILDNTSESIMRIVIMTAKIKIKVNLLNRITE
jgi:hypothetical protein